MRTERYKLEKALENDNKRMQNAILEELNEMRAKTSMDLFFRNEKSVYTFDVDKMTFRIDCQLASDRRGYTGDEVLYFLQLQSGHKTYANVTYPEDDYSVDVLIDAIGESITSGMGVRVLYD